MKVSLCTCYVGQAFFFFNDTATTEIYTLSLHDALPILTGTRVPAPSVVRSRRATSNPSRSGDRKSTRLNSSHPSISYAVFCLKKKKTDNTLSNHHRSSIGCGGLHIKGLSLDVVSRALAS